MIYFGSSNNKKKWSKKKQNGGQNQDGSKHEFSIAQSIFMQTN
jgi:hypothetical protein